MTKLGKVLALPFMLLFGLTGCDKKSTPAPEPQPEPAYVAEEVMQDICLAIFGSAEAEEDYFSDGEDGFYTGVMFGEYGEEYLAAGVQVTASYLPEYLLEVQAPEMGTWDDGEPGCFASYAPEDESVAVFIGSYIYSGYLCAQINVL